MAYCGTRSRGAPVHCGLGEQAQAIGDAVGVIEVGALVVGVQDVEVVEALRAECVDVASGHFAGRQRQLVDVLRQRSIWRRQGLVLVVIEGADQFFAVGEPTQLRPGQRRAVRREVQDRGQIADQKTLRSGQTRRHVFAGPI